MQTHQFIPAALPFPTMCLIDPSLPTSHNHVARPRSPGIQVRKWPHLEGSAPLVRVPGPRFPCHGLCPQPSVPFYFGQAWKAGIHQLGLRKQCPCIARLCGGASDELILQRQGDRKSSLPTSRGLPLGALRESERAALGKPLSQPGDNGALVSPHSCRLQPHSKRTHNDLCCFCLKQNSCSLKNMWEIVTPHPAPDRFVTDKLTVGYTPCFLFPVTK